MREYYKVFMLVVKEEFVPDTSIRNQYFENDKFKILKQC